MAKKYPKLSHVLKKLLFDREMKPIDLARELNIPQPTIHRLVTGKCTRPYRSSLEPIAKYFSLTIDQLLGEESCEAENHAQASIVKLPEKPRKFRQVPVVVWDKISDLINSNEDDNQDADENYIMGNTALSDKSFAAIMNDSSMDPVFPKGTTLVFDPAEEAKDRSYVLVKLKDTKSPIFRQLLIDGEDKYLKPLNPDLSNFRMRLMEEDDLILAVLIEARTSFH